MSTGNTIINNEIITSCIYGSLPVPDPSESNESSPLPSISLNEMDDAMVCN